jgi:hypothetical protein
MSASQSRALVEDGAQNMRSDFRAQSEGISAHDNIALRLNRPPRGDLPIVATLRSRAANLSRELHWQSPTVDLLELLGLDSSVANRRLLAQELSYPSDPTDAGPMDPRLYQTVMSNLAGMRNLSLQ